MSRKEFVPLNLLAKSAGISRQAVWKACQRGNWRGHALEVRVVQGKGGNAGKDYLVSLASLPPALQLRLKPIETRAQNRPKPIASRGRRGRADQGKRRVVISRQWDALVPFDHGTKAKIAEDIKQEIRGLLAAGAAWGHVKILARNFLAETTRSWGFRPNDPASFEKACSIPWTLVSEEMHYRKVHQFRTNRKAYEDSRPRGRRSIEDMRPMELVVGDVHPIDIHLTRADGSICTAKLIGFLDWATGRVWCDLIAFDTRGGVNNRDVIEVFAAMVDHPAFGLPETLYIDNGKEYGFATYLDDATTLTVPGFHGPGRSMRVVNALPYNASAKPIERWFGDFESRYLSTLPGWISGNRMNKRQEAIGRTVAPYGTFEDFVPAFFGLLKAYHSMPTGKQSGLKGHSPNTTFQQHVVAGWSAITMSRDEVRAAVARRVERTVIQGAIQLRGRRWSCEELWQYSHDKVLVCEPVYHAPAELLVLDMKGKRLGIATPDVPLHPLDHRGAQSTAARAKAHRDAIVQMARSVPKIDVAARLMALGQDQPQVIPNEPAGKVSFDPSQRPARIVMPKKPLISEERRREQDKRIAAQMDLVKRIVG
ncbi:hypothetical protein RFN25_07475 [Mesorhizobium abyssinicae]|uniref:hypothetical protein n=1 Tax=Mesorhizobium abyssinicae TaxID=1209958 RepID=UPI002A24B539|nr:hypothetical protein [Mesorhizobium abyssinicae]MDX8433273.1 hypothetical protein [Mesorhizobium abyssinicae]